MTTRGAKLLPSSCGNVEPDALTSRAGIYRHVRHSISADSVTAIFAVTSEPLVVFTSNVFAILGMRVLYSLLVGIVSKFSLLKYALGSILVLVGLKMAWL
ncbi:MAG: hypothetical protein DMG70_03860, partial [Acidobacteria bacterium]